MICHTYALKYNITKVINQSVFPFCQEKKIYQHKTFYHVSTPSNERLRSIKKNGIEIM